MVYFCIYCHAPLSTAPLLSRGIPKPCSDPCRLAVRDAAASFRRAEIKQVK